MTIAVIVAAALVAYGFSRSDDPRPGTDTIPIVGVIQSPANVATTLGPPGPSQTTPGTADVPTIPTGTADVAFPPVSVDIPGP
ncbi:MAG TPA: hypothetical protein VGC84_18860 [Ilumatobacteraceae bacterium]